MYEYKLFTEHVCAACGKDFYVPYKSGGGRPGWVYKFRKGNHLYYLCTNKCFNEYAKNQNQKSRKVLAK